MSRIDDLIAELCPGRVEVKTLGDLGATYGGLTGKTKADFGNGQERFLSYMNVFSNLSAPPSPESRVVIADNERQNQVHRGDVLFTASSERLDEVGMSCAVIEEPDAPTYLNSFCFGFRPTDPDALVPGFAKYLFRSSGVRKQIVRTASGVTRFNISKRRFLSVAVPIPPMHVQNAIAAALDSFTELQAELEAELEARRQQYAYYRDSLLTFDERERERERERESQVGDLE